MSKIIAHIDLNTFFVRVEEIKDPSLIGKPIGIGNEGRSGIISTCSYVARKYGVGSGMPTFEAKKICPQLILKPADSKLINLLSREFISYLKQFSSKIEQLSCDECYLDLTESYRRFGHNNIYNYLKNIQNGLYKKTKLKCSIGIGPTKFLAKMGSDYKKPMGITIIRKKDIKNILFPLDVKNFYGIGKKTYPKLYKINIHTIGDLYNKLIDNDYQTLSLIGNQKDYILACLEGRTSDVVETQRSDPKSIGTTRTLPFDMSAKDDIVPYLLEEIKRITLSLKEEKKLAKTITITYKDAKCIDDFKVTTISKTLDEYTDSEEKLTKEGLKLFDSSFKNQEIRLIGFTVKNLIDRNEAVVQMTFDNYMIHEKESELYLLINKINRDFKKEVLVRASDLKKKNGNK